MAVASPHLWRPACTHAFPLPRQKRTRIHEPGNPNPRIIATTVRTRQEANTSKRPSSWQELEYRANTELTIEAFGFVAYMCNVSEKLNQ
ncbi:Uncharacterised protein [Trueperella bialowiezensis]|uniref:Uncharacterized protein n=1 Tax=Trueperella bialowiezensis TaxID=312285 RepID=A0A3S4VAW4_9ACTO|nr:Uncharacterised protein [Trueperella bialowiezensis]